MRDELSRVYDRLQEAHKERDALRAELAAERERKDPVFLWEEIRKHNAARKAAEAERDALRAELDAQADVHTQIQMQLSDERDALRAVLAKIRRDYSSAFMPEDAAGLDATLNKGATDAGRL